MKKVLFIDRDGTLVIEPPITYQVDTFEQLEFYPGVMRHLGFIRSKLDFEFALVSNQDGLGKPSYPRERFDAIQRLIMQTLEGEGITFDEIYIDPSTPEEHSPNRKPRTGMLGKYIDNPEYDLAGSFVIGDRETDAQLARNLGCKSLILKEGSMDWAKVQELAYAGERTAEVERKTKETDIRVCVNLDGDGQADIRTGLG